MKAVCFAIRRRDTEAIVGYALVAAGARYASVLWIGGGRIDRRFGTPAAWRAVIAQLSSDLPRVMLDSKSPAAVLLLAEDFRLEHGLTSTWTRDAQGEPHLIIEQLDAWLRDIH